MYFESSQSQLFKILIDSYAGILAGKNMVDIMLRVKKVEHLKNNLKHVPELNKFVESFTSSLEMDVSLKSKIKLAVEEAVVNVMTYAYPEGTKGYVDISAQSDNSGLKFIISDSGKPFDPTTKEEVDTTLPAEQREIGGLGIFLVRKMMDSVKYEYKDGHNILTLKKKTNQ